MKRIILILAAMAMFSTVSKADKPLSFDKLPIPAQEYVKSSVPDLTISTVKKDGSEFDVVFADGTKISFDKKGQCLKAKNKIQTIDRRLIPALIREKVEVLYNGVIYEKIEFKSKGYEVELSNGVELTFDKNYKLTHVDD